MPDPIEPKPPSITEARLKLAELKEARDNLDAERENYYRDAPGSGASLIRHARDKFGSLAHNAPLPSILATWDAMAARFDMHAHLARQRAWSEKTFGPGFRVAGVVDHIRKELREIEAQPGDLEEWIDVVILALDGAWRAGYSPEQIVAQLVAKQAKNEGRKWPDWRTAPSDKAIEHERTLTPDAGRK